LLSFKKLSKNKLLTFTSPNESYKNPVMIMNLWQQKV